MVVWHIVAATLVLLLVGVVIHVSRASFNFMPDVFMPARGRLFREFFINDMMSSNYSFWDMVVGTEYDEDGFYEFFSRKNLRLACTHSLVVGMAILLSIDPLWQAFAQLADKAPGWLWDLFVYRIENLKFI